MSQMRPARSEKPILILGWREWLALPDLRVPLVKAKIDTGARTSALHAFDVRIHGRRVDFTVCPLQRDDRTRVKCSARLLDSRWVTSSNGSRERRPVIRTHVLLGGVSWPIELTLTSRDVMGFRMLLGREAIRRRWLVDPGRSFLASKKKKKKKKRAK